MEKLISNKSVYFRSAKSNRGVITVRPLDLIWWIFLLPFLIPTMIWENLGGYKVQYYSQMIATIGLAIFCLFHVKIIKKKFLLLICISIFNGTYVVSTIINGGNYQSAAMHFIVLLLLCCLVSICVENITIAESVMCVVRDITILFFLLNIILELVFPHGLTKSESINGVGYWLYGNPNTVIRKILPGFSCSMIIDRLKEKISMQTLLFWIGVLFQLIFIYFSAATFVAVLLLFFWCVFENKLSKYYRTTYLILLIIVILFEAYIVINGTGGGIRDTIVSLLGKDVTFSGRSYLWKRTIRLFTEKPIWGYGQLNNDLIYIYIGNSNGAHNYYLDVAFQRGIVGVFSLILIMMLPLFRIKNRFEDVRNIQRSVFHVLLGFTYSIYIMFLMEPFFSSEYLIIPMIFLSLVFCFEFYRNNNPA